jgi:hypothetical protein
MPGFPGRGTAVFRRICAAMGTLCGLLPDFKHGCCFSSGSGGTDGVEDL